MQQLYYDSIAIVAKYSLLHFFLTFTANLKWLEILNKLVPKQTAADCLDLVACVFYIKMTELF